MSIEVPERAPLETLRLRLRVPGGKRIASLTLDGAPYDRVLADGQTIVLPTTPGTLQLEARFG